MQKRMKMDEGCAAFVYDNRFISETYERMWIEIGMGFATMGNSEKAIRSFKYSLKHNPNSGVALYELGKSYLECDYLESVGEVAQKLGSYEEYQFYSNCLFGHFYLKKNDIMKSYDHFKKAGINSEMYDSCYLYGIGLMYEAVGNDGMAYKFFLRHHNYFNLYNKNVEILFRLAIIYKKERVYSMVPKIFNILLQMKDIRPLKKNDIYVQIAHTQELKNDNESAMNTISNILKNDSKYIFAIRLKAWILFKVGDYAKAESYLKSVIKIYGGDSYLWYLLARSRFELKKIEESFDSYRVALITERGNHWYWNSAGVLYFMNKQYEEARVNFMNALKIEPDFDEAKYNYNMACEMIGLDSEEKRNSGVGCGDAEGSGGSQTWDVRPDISNTPYFTTQLFLGGPIYKYDKSKIESFDLPVESILNKTLKS
jgi:tetratricopeptide (TPR) repeat protein